MMWKTIILVLTINGTITGPVIFIHYLELDPVQRQYDHDQLTLSMLYAYCEHYVLTLGTRSAGEISEFMDKLPGDENRSLPR